MSRCCRADHDIKPSRAANERKTGCSFSTIYIDLFCSVLAGCRIIFPKALDGDRIKDQHAPGERGFTETPTCRSQSGLAVDTAEFVSLEIPKTMKA
jgi:hypothetical protein